MLACQHLIRLDQQLYLFEDIGREEEPYIHIWCRESSDHGQGGTRLVGAL